MIDALKEFTRTFLADGALWLMTNTVTLLFAIVLFPFLQFFKKNREVNVIPIILMAISGIGVAWATELSVFYIGLGALAGGAMGYWLDRYCARHIGERISGAPRNSFRNLFRKSSSSSSSSSTRSSSPKSTNSNFGGGNFSGGGGNSSW